MRTIRVFSVVAVACLVGTSALGYTFNVTSGGTPRTWEAGAVAMSVNTYNWTEGSADHEAIEDAVTAWSYENVGGTTFGATEGNFYNSTLNYSNNDNVNAIQLSDDLGPCNGEGSTLAATDLRYGTPFYPARIREADIVLNSACNDWASDIDYYDVNDANIRANSYDLRIAVLHEMGHVVGLDHEKGDWDTELVVVGDIGIIDIVGGSGWPTVMHASYDGTGAAIADDGYLSRIYGIGEDDRQGLRALYGGGSSKTDYSAQSYYVPADDTIDGDWLMCASEFVYKARPSPYKSLMTCPTNDNTDPMTNLTVASGGSVTTVFTFHDLGTTSSSSLGLKYALRSSPTGTTGYTLSTPTISMSPGTPYQRTATLSTAGVPSGTWYLTVDIDPANAIAEASETNNRAIWNRRIVIP